MQQYQLVRCGAPLQLATATRPSASGAEVVVRVRAAGVCHTDLHLSDGYFDLGGGKRVELTDRGITLPHTLGHEIAGEVVETGPQAQGVKPGDRVVVYPWIGCGECATCAAGEGHLCAKPRFLGVFRPGGFSSHVVVPHPRFLFPLGDIAPERAAPLACSGLTAFSALRKADLSRGPLVLVGAGGLGLMALGLLKMLGAPGAHLIEPQADKRQAAMRLGALGAWSNDEAGIAALKGHVGDGVAAVVDFVGSPLSVAQSFPLLAKGGKLIVVGMFGGEAALPIPLLVLRAATVQGSYVGSLAEMRELVALVKDKGVPALPIATRPLDDVNEALAAMRAGQVVGRTVLQVPHTQ